ncbi:MAG: tetratricopeptide repeat protein [Acidobacteriota bacterium]|nr:tetratricopeptide repeat protein [Acidobacteriota bacterium]
MSGLRRVLVAGVVLLGVGALAQSPVPDAPQAAAAPMTVEQIQSLIDRGRNDEAMKNLSALASRSPEPAGVERLRGVVLYAQNRFTEAESAFAAAMAADPKDLEATQLRGLALFRMGKPAIAIPYLEKANQWTAHTKVDPSYVLALCYLDARRYDDARHAFAAQYGFAGDSAAAYLVTARMLLRREYVPIAQQFASKALELNPGLPLAHQLLGEIALSQEHLDEAMQELEKEKATNPLDPAVYDRLGDAYLRAGKYTQATQALQQAVLLEPNATGPYILLGKALLKQQDAVAAATYLERAVQMDPSNYMTHSLLGQAYRALGKQEEASREQHEAQRIQAANEPKLDTAH